MLPDQILCGAGQPPPLPYSPLCLRDFIYAVFFGDFQKETALYLQPRTLPLDQFVRLFSFPSSSRYLCFSRPIPLSPPFEPFFASLSFFFRFFFLRSSVLCGTALLQTFTVVFLRSSFPPLSFSGFSTFLCFHRPMSRQFFFSAFLPRRFLLDLRLMFIDTFSFQRPNSVRVDPLVSSLSAHLSVFSC